MGPPMQCLLCHGNNSGLILERDSRSFYQCRQCDLVFVDPKHWLSPEKEKARYLEHNNDVSDPDYRGFVTPLIEAIESKCAKGSTGLDFGAGTGPVLSVMLQERNYQVETYDPYFWPNENLLKASFDFVCTSEVVEHFYRPNQEFALLKDLLKGKGWLGIMTHLRDEKTDLQNWYYLKDPTHVVFYSPKTFEWIKNTFGFSHLEIKDRVILLRL